MAQSTRHYRCANHLISERIDFATPRHAVDGNPVCSDPLTLNSTNSIADENGNFMRKLTCKIVYYLRNHSD